LPQNTGLQKLYQAQVFTTVPTANAVLTCLQTWKK